MTPYFDDVMAPLVAAEALKPKRLRGRAGRSTRWPRWRVTRIKLERHDHAQRPSHPWRGPHPHGDVPRLAQQLAEQDVHHRAAMPGMDPARVDLMPFSVALIEWVPAWASSTTWCVRPRPARGGRCPA